MTLDERADLAEATVPIACDMAVRVRDGDAEGIARIAELKRWDAETVALVVVLAAGWPVEDSSSNELLAWTDGLEAALEWRQAQLPLPAPGRPVTEPCGTYAAWARHKRHKEPADPACERAYLDYHRASARESMARHRARKREAAARETADAA